MQIEKIKVDEIIPYEDNAKLHPERQIEQIRSSILEFGFNDPIAIDENNVVIEGNGRLMAIKGLGFKEYEKDDTLSSVQCKNLDKVFDAMLDFLDQTGAYSVAFAQGGDFIGGATSQFWQKKIHRKVMNSFFCRTDKPFKFLGSINEDVNAYVTLGQKGKLFFTISECMLVQTATQQSKGGLTDIYLDLGTYVKSFYSVICSPSCVKVHSMGVNYMRIHHKVEADKCYPKIINERYKKK